MLCGALGFAGTDNGGTVYEGGLATVSAIFLSMDYGCLWTFV